MSGYSEAVDCPRCGSTESLKRSIERDDVSGYCLECGYSYDTVYNVMTLDETNEERAVLGLEPLAELKKPVEGWKDEVEAPSQVVEPPKPKCPKCGAEVECLVGAYPASVPARAYIVDTELYTNIVDTRISDSIYGEVKSWHCPECDEELFVEGEEGIMAAFLLGKTGTRMSYLCLEGCTFFHGEDGCGHNGIDEIASYEMTGDYPLCPLYTGRGQ